MSSNLLLVEGTSDHALIRQLWERHHPQDAAFSVTACTGLQDLRRRFKASLYASDIGRLGVIVDADDAPEARWPGFYQALVEAKYPGVPRVPPAEGVVLHRPGRPISRVGVWVMPNNRDAGRLEDLVRHMVRPGDALWAHAEAVVHDIPPELVKFRRQHEMKAHVHTWLAWQEEPGMRLGPAVRRGVLDPHAPEALAVVSWLRNVFGD